MFLFKRLISMVLVLSIMTTSLFLVFAQPVHAEDVRTMYSNGSLQEIEEMRHCLPPYIAGSPAMMSFPVTATASSTKSYYVKGGFSHLIHMTAAHLW